MSQRCTVSRNRGSQQGASLIELLIALALISLVVLALAGGLLTLIKVTSVTQVRQQMTLALGNSSESIKALPYQACAAATAASYAASYDAWEHRWQPRDGMVVSIVDIAYWDRTSKSFVTGRPAACSITDPGVQRLTIRVDYRDEVRSGQVVKRAMG